MPADQFEMLMQAMKELSKEVSEIKQEVSEMRQEVVTIKQDVWELKLLIEEHIAWREYAEKRFERIERRMISG